MNNEPVVGVTPPKNVWTSCVACGQRVTSDSIHTCSPQLKTLTDEEIHQVFRDTWDATTNPNCVFTAFARAILRKAQEK